MSIRFVLITIRDLDSQLFTKYAPNVWYLLLAFIKTFINLATGFRQGAIS